MNVPDEAQLIQRSRAGDPQAVEMLVDRYQQAVFRLALAILEDLAEAEEAAQDSFVAAFNRLGSFQGKATFKTWLFAITINRCRGQLRKRQRRERLGKVLPRLFRGTGPGQVHPEEQVIKGEREREVRLSMNGLDEKHRLPLVLRYYYELPIAEIARILGVTERTVHNRLRAAHIQLTGRLESLER